MAAVDVIARYLHIGSIKQYSTGELRPECDTCSWKGPKYGPADGPVAQVGLDAHIATTDDAGGSLLYQMTRVASAHWSMPFGDTDYFADSQWTWDWDQVRWSPDDG